MSFLLDQFLPMLAAIRRLHGEDGHQSVYVSLRHEIPHLIHVRQFFVNEDKEIVFGVKGGLDGFSDFLKN